MKDFLNKTWVVVLGWVLALLGAAVLICGGTSVGAITEGVELVAGIIDAIVLLIAFIKKMLEKKDETKK